MPTGKILERGTLLQGGFAYIRRAKEREVRARGITPSSHREAWHAVVKEGTENISRAHTAPAEILNGFRQSRGQWAHSVVTLVDRAGTATSSTVEDLARKLGMLKTPQGTWIIPGQRKKEQPESDRIKLAIEELRKRGFREDEEGVFGHSAFGKKIDFREGLNPKVEEIVRRALNKFDRKSKPG